MTLSNQLNKELNKTFTNEDAIKLEFQKAVYGSNKRRLEIKKQNRAKKWAASL
jgi:hypothetical protein